jgi:hypothetical protein
MRHLTKTFFYDWQAIIDCPGTLGMVRQSMIRRVHACIEVEDFLSICGLILNSYYVWNLYCKCVCQW